MNAPRNEAVRKAQTCVTLDNKAQRGLQHTYMVSCAAVHGGLGGLQAAPGGGL